MSIGQIEENNHSFREWYIKLKKNFGKEVKRGVNSILF